MNDTVNGDERTCSGSVNKVMQGYLLSGFLAIVGLLFIFVLDKSSPDAVLIGCVPLLFAVIVGALAYRGARNSDRLLVLNNEGMFFKGWSNDVIPWPQIAKVEPGGSRISAFLRVELSDPAAPRPMLKIPAGDLSVPMQEVVEVAQGFMSRSA